MSAARSTWRLLFGAGIAILFLLPILPAYADDLTISATVHSPAPTQAALITSHYDGQRVPTKDAIIRGTCSLDTAFVELRRNSVFAGTTLCTAGVFEIPLTFLLGPNQLQVIALSSTGNAGPPSPIITVFYDPPAPEKPPLAPPAPLAPLIRGSGEPCRAQLAVLAAPPYQEGSVQHRLGWTLSMPSGCAPYRITADWGDGIVTIDKLEQKTYTLTHTYQTPGYYAILFRITDAAGQQSVIQVIAVIRAGASPQASLPTTPSPDWVVPTIVAATLTSVVLVAGGWRWIFRFTKWVLYRLFG